MKISKKILRILESDARATTGQISAMTGIPVDEVKRSVDIAEKDKIIIKYKTMINWERLGEKRVIALIEVKLTPQRGVGFDSLAERIYKFPEARSVYLVSGMYDLAVLVTANTMHEIANFVSNNLAPLEGVQSTVTHFLLKRYKDDGEILDGAEETKRLPVTP